ncbi:hypothetical protein RQP46_010469 [Phenoliferia psychrophenolica]
MTSLLTLPNELLLQIAMEVAPTGGRAAANLRLVCHRLEELVSPIVWSALSFSAKSERRLDALQAALLRNPLLGAHTTSVKVSIRKGGHEVTALILANLPILKQLHLLGLHGPIPAAIFAIIPSLKLSSLSLENIEVENHGDFQRWGAGITTLSLRGCYEASKIFHGPAATRPAEQHLIKTELWASEHDNSSSQVWFFFETLYACGVETKEVILRTNPKEDRPLVFPETWKDLLEDKWAGHSAMSVKLQGPPAHFLPSTAAAPRTAAHAVVALLNWIGDALEKLDLSSGKGFEVPDELLRLSLRRLTSLTLSANKSESDDILTKDTYHHLARFLNSTSFPALTSLSLRGWLDSTDVATLAHQSILDLVDSHKALYRLLDFLRSTTICELRLENSDFHDRWDVRCIFERVGSGDWEMRKVWLD